MYRRMQNVIRDTAGALRWPMSSSCKYSLIENADDVVHFSCRCDDFTYSVCAFVDTTDDHSPPFIIQRSDTQWESIVSPQFLATFFVAHGKEEIRRQCAIHELLINEMNLCYDILLLLHFYQRSMLDAKVLTAEEAVKLFPGLDSLFNVHLQLVQQLLCHRTEDFVYDLALGELILSWIETIYWPYVVYLEGLKEAQKLLRKKCTCKEFLQVLESSDILRLSRKLPLSSFLDSPRSHLMKLSLMFQQILKSTKCPAEQIFLTNASELIRQKIVIFEEKQAVKEFNAYMSQFLLNEETIREILNGSTKIVHSCRVRRSRFNRGKPKLILFNRALALVRRSYCQQKYFFLAQIHTGNEMFYDFGKAKGTLKGESGKGRFQKRLKATKGKRPFTSNTSLCRRLKRHQASSKQSQPCSRTSSSSGELICKSKTLHLYSLQVKFDICIKMSTADEVQLWKSKLETCFELKAGASARQAHSR